MPPCLILGAARPIRDTELLYLQTVAAGLREGQAQHREGLVWDSYSLVLRALRGLTDALEQEALPHG